MKIRQRSQAAAQDRQRGAGPDGVGGIAKAQRQQTARCLADARAWWYAREWMLLRLGLQGGRRTGGDSVTVAWRGGANVVAVEQAGSWSRSLLDWRSPTDWTLGSHRMSRRVSHKSVSRAILSRAHVGTPVDAITVTDGWLVEAVHSAET